jgi:hypothetical protein
MRLTKAFLCLALLLVVGGCQWGTIEPIPVAPLAAVTVECPASVQVGQTAQCTAKATDEEGNPINYVPISLYRWDSSDPAVAKVVSRGEVTALKAGGPVTLRARLTLGSVTREGTAQLTVTALPPTVHSTPITADETWREANNPHLVRCPSMSRLEVNGASAPVTLTLEAGVEVLFEADCELRITNGALKAMGTQEKAIRMASSQSNPVKGAWRGLVFNTAGSASELNHVTLSHCGASAGEDACIALMNGAKPVLRHVTVENSGTAGVGVADDGSAFGTGSTVLSVSGSESYAVRMGANQADTLPAGGTFTGNTLNAVEIRGNISRTQTWLHPGIPYVINSNVMVAGTDAPELTLGAGTVLRFGADFGLYIASPFPAELPGGLIVDGTADKPVLLTSDSATPAPGDWRGVHLLGDTTNTARISHATIEYAGAGETVHRANLVVYGISVDDLAYVSRPVVNDVVFQKSSAAGAYFADYRGFGEGSARLTFRDNESIPLAMPPNEVRSIPTTLTFSNNAINYVLVNSGNVFTSQTWPKLELPYRLLTYFYVIGTLTLQPGTDVLARVDSGISFGDATSPTQGALVAVGTPTAPIRFIPDTPSASPGHWRGLYFWKSEGSRLDYVTVTHGGSDSTTNGNVNVLREIGAFITNSTFKDSAGCGITGSTGTRTGSTAVTTNFTAAALNNAFINNSDGTQCTAL